MTNLSDTLLVSISFSDKDTGVLVVGRKRKNQSIDIINAFQGEEALDLYKKLVTKKEQNHESLRISQSYGIRRNG